MVEYKLKTANQLLWEKNNYCVIWARDLLDIGSSVEGSTKGKLYELKHKALLRGIKNSVQRFDLFMDGKVDYYKDVQLPKIFLLVQFQEGDYFN